MATSTAYILLKSAGWKYSFDGVLSISHSLSLKVAVNSDASSGTDYVNNARNQPDVVTLSVVASDTNTAVPNWSASILQALAAVKEQRDLCQVVTSLRTYDNMLLTDISVLQDDTCPFGWSGTLTFTHTDPPSEEARTDDGASTPSGTGNTGTITVTGSGSGSGGQAGSTFLVILQEAGIRT